MAKLYAELTSDKGGRKVSKSDNKSISIDLFVKNSLIGTIELYLFNDISDGCDADEYLLKYYRPSEDQDVDPLIVTQGNL